MSHYTKMAVLAKQSNEGELIDALKAQFGEDVEVYDQAKPLRLWNGQKAGAGGYNSAPDCHIIVRRETQSKKMGHDVLSNDAGYRRTEDGGYEAHIDAAGFPKTMQDAVMRDYVERVTAKKMKAQNYTMSRKVLADGRVQLRFQKYA